WSHHYPDFVAGLDVEILPDVGLKNGVEPPDDFLVTRWLVPLYNQPVGKIEQDNEIMLHPLWLRFLIRRGKFATGQAQQGHHRNKRMVSVHIIHLLEVVSDWSGAFGYNFDQAAPDVVLLFELLLQHKASILDVPQVGWGQVRNPSGRELVDVFLQVSLHNDAD